mgnify:CR=1 FL=1
MFEKCISCKFSRAAFCNLFQGLLPRTLFILIYKSGGGTDARFVKFYIFIIELHITGGGGAAKQLTLLAKIFLYLLLLKYRAMQFLFTIYLNPKQSVSLARARETHKNIFPKVFVSLAFFFISPSSNRKTTSALKFN